MKIIIPGGTGQIGQILANAFHNDGHHVVVVSRTPRAANWHTVTWDGQTVGAWAKEIDGADVVINLAGRSVNCRYNSSNRKQILDSRVDSVKAVGAAISQATHQPSLWLQMSTATIYSHRYDAPNDDFSGILGGNEPNLPDTWQFSIEVAKAWERAFDETDTPLTRKVKLRTAMVMSPDTGGVFDVLLGLVRKGLGGRAGDGRQYVSWIHGEDFVHAINWLIQHENIIGAVNLAAPEPLPNSKFMSALRAANGTSVGLPATKLMLEIGAVFLRTETELILKSRRVIPKLLVDSGFVFRHPRWPDAAKDLHQKWRALHKSLSTF